MVDFFTDYQLVKNGKAGAHAIENTRILMQNAFWLSMAFDEARTHTRCFGDEVHVTTPRAARTPHDLTGRQQPNYFLAFVGVTAQISLLLLYLVLIRFQAVP